MGLPPLLPTLEIFYGVAEDKSMRDYMQARLELLLVGLSQGCCLLLMSDKL